MKFIWNTLAAALMLPLGFVSTANATTIEVDLAVDTGSGLANVLLEVETDEVLGSASELLGREWNQNNTNIVSLNYEFWEGSTISYDFSDSRTGNSYANYAFTFDALDNFNYLSVDIVSIYDGIFPDSNWTNFVFNSVYYFSIDHVNHLTDVSIADNRLNGISGSIGIASATVPNPATLALFLLGFGVMT